MTTSDHAEPFAAFVDGPQQRMHQLFVRVVVWQTELVEARVGGRQCTEGRCGGYLEPRVQLLKTRESFV